MGLVYVDLRLGHFERSDIEEINADALVDTGAINLCISQAIATKLKLTKIATKKATLADGSVQHVDVVGGIQVSLMGRSTVTTALVLGNQVLLGAIPLEDMDFLVDAPRQRLIPADPNSINAVVA
jgi:clan AA aspartic protease